MMTEIYVLSGYQASPRERHMKQIYHVFALLNKNHKPTLYFGPIIDPSWFQGDIFENFKDKYQDASEQLPPS